jgi:hypothetical protein
MNEIRLGQIIDAGQQRDAIHIAVAPVVADEELSPGEHIGFVAADQETVGTASGTLLGIVDPFLTASVAVGQRFWMFLYPQTITSLRHDWTHPAFETQRVVREPASDSRAAIESIAADLDMTYNQLMRAAELWINDEEYTVEHGSEHWRDTFPAFVGTFWKHYEIVTGKTVPDHDAMFFSCSC